MWTALHFVKHNQPDNPPIQMEGIFDQQWPLPGPHGSIRGGAGKVEMYGSTDAGLCEVEFACEPFNELFWDLWELFSGYLEQMLGWARAKTPRPGE